MYARQSLAGLLAKSWFLATETRFQIRLAESAIVASARLTELVETRRRVGSANDLDVALARAEVAGYRDRLVELTRIEAESRRAIEVLLGRYPAAAIALRETFPESLPPVPAGLPLQLLERRPDLVAANFRVSQAFFARKQAVAARLPTLSLTGSFGAISSEVLSFKADFSNPVGSLGAGLLVPLFRGGALKGQVEVRTAEQRAAVAAYGGSVLTSFQEVENALGAEQILRQRAVLLEQIAAEITHARQLTETQYATGKVDLSPVLDMRMREYAAETALLRVRAERVTQRVNLHLALGGGFAPAPPSGKAGL
jgi:outer membrane protein TolC